MGMYSTINECYLAPLKKHSMEDMEEWLSSEMPDYLTNKAYGTNYASLKKSFYDEYIHARGTNNNNVLSEDQLLHDCFMACFDGAKIISYWYQHFGAFIRDLAQFVEGEVYLTFETGDEFARIIFKEGEATIQIGEITFSEKFNVDDLCSVDKLPEKELIRRQL